MELSDVIVGTKLNEIQKKSDGVKLVFENTTTHRVFVLTFNGLLFETSTPTLNKRVKHIQVNNALGFRALSQLRNLNLNPENYRQLFIQMEGSDDNNKLELIGAFGKYRISARRKAAINSKPPSQKHVVKK